MIEWILGFGYGFYKEWNEDQKDAAEREHRLRSATSIQEIASIVRSVEQSDKQQGQLIKQLCEWANEQEKQTQKDSTVQISRRAFRRLIYFFPIYQIPERFRCHIDCYQLNSNA